MKTSVKNRRTEWYRDCLAIVSAGILVFYLLTAVCR